MEPKRDNSISTVKMLHLLSSMSGTLSILLKWSVQISRKLLTISMNAQDTQMVTSYTRPSMAIQSVSIHSGCIPRISLQVISDGIIMIWFAITANSKRTSIRTSQLISSALAITSLIIVTNIDATKTQHAQGTLKNKKNGLSMEIPPERIVSGSIRKEKPSLLRGGTSGKTLAAIQSRSVQVFGLQ